MPDVPGSTALRAHPKKYGLLIVAVGMISLLLLRFWASPLTVEMTGRGQNGLFEFLLIPVFLLLVGIGVAIFLWEPSTEKA